MIHPHAHAKYLPGKRYTPPAFKPMPKELEALVAESKKQAFNCP